MACSVARFAFAKLGAQQSRNYATLKDISIRLKSVKNIQKITQSMKMVAAAKYNRAERDLRPVRSYGEGATVFYDHLKLPEPETKSDYLMVVVSSDRGLCGAVHSGLCKLIKTEIQAMPESNVRLVCIGDKSKAILSRAFPEKIIITANDVGKKPPTFEDARSIANAVLGCGYAFDRGGIYYNKFKSAVSYQPTKVPLFSRALIMETPEFSAYDSVDDSTLESFYEYSLTSMLYFAMKENSCSEQSSRMTTMDSASKNAGEMIDNLSLVYNRTRQSVITRELIDIVVGASAL